MPNEQVVVRGLQAVAALPETLARQTSPQGLNGATGIAVVRRRAGGQQFGAHLSVDILGVKAL
ncbi:MAG TPA: hypothetical protein VKQ30_00180 [Ktedonobacterales bacterium]|nr:hypothetical protein [Ktedonobacterales bacterium]